MEAVKYSCRPLCRFSHFFCNKFSSVGVCISKTPTVKFFRDIRINFESVSSGMNTAFMENNDAITLREGIYYLRLAWAEASLEIALHGIGTITDAFIAYGILNASSPKMFA